MRYDDKIIKNTYPHVAHIIFCSENAITRMPHQHHLLWSTFRCRCRKISLSLRSLFDCRHFSRNLRYKRLATAKH